MDKINQLPVMNDGQFEGILSEENIVRFMRTLQELNRSRP
jgi:predicted transcriptional regulator